MLLNVVIMVGHSESDATLFSWSPYTDCSANKPPLQAVDYCSWGTFINNTNLYPNKVPLQLNQCPVRISAYIGPPFTMLINNLITGPQTALTAAILEKLNITLFSNLNTFTPPVNSTELLVKRLVDIHYSTQLISVENFERACLTPSYFQGEFVIVVPTPKSDIFSCLYSGFSSETWCLIIVAIISMLIFVSVVDVVSRQTYSVADVLRTAFGNSVIGRPMHFVSFKIIVIIFELYSLHIIWFYQINSLSNLFRGSFEKPIKTLQDAADKELTLFYSWHKSNFFNRTEHDAWNKISKFWYPTYDPDLAQISEKKSAMWFELKQYIIYYFKELYPNTPLSTKINFIKKPIALEHFTLLMPVNHPLCPLISRNVLIVFESGIFNYWVKWITYIEKFADIKTEEPLTLLHMQPVFYILLLFHSIAVLIIVFEMSSKFRVLTSFRYFTK